MLKLSNFQFKLLYHLAKKLYFISVKLHFILEQKDFNLRGFTI